MMTTTSPQTKLTSDENQALRRVALAASVSVAALLSGCATTTGPANPADPLESMNRSIYSFNEGVDEAIFKPVATAYQNVTPRVARQGVTNFFDNLGDAWSFVNNVLQGQGQGAYNSMVRFSVNTVLGIGGLFDIASEAGIERQKQDFGQTLGRWGMPTGPYLVLPFWGPSTVRDSAGLVVDAFGYPANTMDDVRWRNSLFGLRMVNNRANLLKAGDVLDSVALDKYSLVRDVYLRSRIGGAASGGDGRLENYDDDNAGKLPPEGQ
ncbi:MULTISPECIES: MlaA family lipoprotein [Comamonas]|uniref:MlaA family lipoprotein n=1 Tax=Comamonas TaxID=283 RepID=UPI0001BB0F54|nr:MULTISPECIES: VacJ family lipoprotein [Comamonas]ACY31450.1 VacJ-like lipoprotein [Comamonas thiooxydans]MBL5977327.1 VacJ family lipoprotein [Comamonas sp. NyZ500]MDH1254580.1 VacJ family lipoprotein [Comamonas thiooxydans]MDH1473831.1 VacJ family lipoprotein [Comamonas thiooxydans]MDO1473291.1 VacJ family lipoprotein [Comamonas thiooxydans]